MQIFSNFFFSLYLTLFLETKISDDLAMEQNAEVGAKLEEVTAGADWYRVDIPIGLIGVNYSKSDIYLPCTINKRNKELAHLTLHNPSMPPPSL